MTDVRIGRLSATFPAALDRGRMDRVLHRIAGRALEEALTAVPLPPGECCVRRLDIRLRIDPAAGDDHIARTWSAALAGAIGRAMTSNDLMVYASRRAAAVDQVTSVALGRWQRAWAWRQLGLLDGPADPVAAIGSALARSGGDGLGILVLAAEAAGVAALHRTLGPDGWVAVAAGLTGARPSAPPAGAGAPRVADLLARSRFAAAVAASGAEPDRRTATAWAAIIAVEADPVLLQRHNAGEVVAAIAAVLAGAPRRAQPDPPGLDGTAAAQPSVSGPSDRTASAPAPHRRGPDRPDAGPNPDARDPGPAGPRPAPGPARPESTGTRFPPDPDRPGSTGTRFPPGPDRPGSGPPSAPADRGTAGPQSRGTGWSAGPDGPARDTPPGRDPAFEPAGPEPLATPASGGPGRPGATRFEPSRTGRFPAGPRRGHPGRPEPATRVLPDGRLGTPTAWGGLVFLLNTAASAGLPGAALRPTLAGRSIRWVVHALATRLVPAEPDDPAVLALCGLTPADRPPAATGEPPALRERRALDRLARRWATRTAARLPTTPTDPTTPVAAVAGLARRAGLVVAEPGWIEVHLPLSAVRLDVRRAGLDLDPGWVPWLRAVVRIVYRGGDDD